MHNEFHVRELYRGELAALLESRFPHTAWYGQRPGFFSVVWPEREAGGGKIFELAEASADTPSPGHARPLYFIVVGSDSAAALGRVASRLSVLADRDESVYRDYEKVMRGFKAAHEQTHALEARLHALEATGCTHCR